MTPQKIDIAETTFRSQFTDSSNTVFTEGTHIDIGDGFEIIPISTTYNSYYYPTKTEKKSIVLHFTVGSIKGDIATLSKKDNHVSVAYLVDRQGHIYQMFDPRYWSYHLGASCRGTNSVMSKQTIGIEVSNYGPLTLTGTEYKDAYKNTYTTDPDMVEKVSKYRGYEYFAKMTSTQELATVHLIHYLCNLLDIPDTFKSDMGTVFNTDSDAKNFCGIFCHTDVRTDKFDWPPDMANHIRDTYDSIYKTPVEPDVQCTEEHSVATDDNAESQQVQQSQQVKTVQTTQQASNTLQSPDDSLLGMLINLLLGLFSK